SRSAGGFGAIALGLAALAAARRRRASRTAFLTLLCGCAGSTSTANNHDSSSDASAPASPDASGARDSALAIDGGTSDASDTGGGAPTRSAGCGKTPRDVPGGVQVTIDAGPAGDGMRGYYLSLPTSYDPTKAHRLILGYPGTDWTGKMIQPYLG